MSSKLPLDQTLLRAGLINADTLRDAKMAAAMSDLSLVEGLLEVRAISEEQLLGVFHKQLGYPLVNDSYFNKIEAAVLDLAPRELLMQHRVLPLYRAQDKLFVAALDPLDPKGLAQIAAATKLQIIVCVARASAVLQALKLHFSRAKAAPAPTRAAAKPDHALSSMLVAKPPSPPAKTQTPQEHYENARVELEHAGDRDAVGRILAVHVAHYFNRVVLLSHRQGMLTGWHTVGTDLTTHRLRGVIVPLHVESVFQHVVQSKTYHIGKLPPNMISSAFLAAIGDGGGGYSLLVPILVDNKVAAVLYADTTSEKPIDVNLSSIYQLAAEAGRTLEQLIRKQRQ